jgi:hypothetical protein
MNDSFSSGRLTSAERSATGQLPRSHHDHHRRVGEMIVTGWARPWTAIRGRYLTPRDPRNHDERVTSLTTAHLGLGSG